MWKKQIRNGIIYFIIAVLLLLWIIYSAITPDSVGYITIYWGGFIIIILLFIGAIGEIIEGCKKYRIEKNLKK